MFERLGEEVDALSVPLDGAAIATAVSLRDRLDARISELVGAFDAASLWDLDAATSMTAWLREHASMTRSRFPGCDRKRRGARPTRGARGRRRPHVHVHLVLLCSRHHHRLHQPGWHAKLLPDATFEVSDPDGRQRTTVSPRAGARLC